MIGAAAGTPQYSGNYIPTVFSSLLLVHLYEVTCLAEISNTNWEGEIKKKGDKVIIRTLPNITVRDRVKNQRIIIENPDSPSKELSIDYEKYFAFIIDRVDEYQADIPLGSQWAAHAAKLMTIDIEEAIFASIYADASSYNVGSSAGYKSNNIDMGVSGTPYLVTEANAYQKVVDMSTILSEMKAPKDDGRYVILPEWMTGMINKSDLKSRDIYGDGTSVAMNGKIGKISGMNTYEVNTLTSVTDGSYTGWHILFGHKLALTFASQFNETDMLKDIEYRGVVMRGFNDYGYEVIKPEVLGDFYARSS